MATAIVADPTQVTLTAFQAASIDMARTLAVLRDHYAPTDRRLGGMLEELRSVFDAFARCRISDPLVLSTLSRVYQDAATTIRSLAETLPSTPSAAHGRVATARGLAYLCADLVTSGSRSVFRRPS